MATKGGIPWLIWSERPKWRIYRESSRSMLTPGNSWLPAAIPINGERVIRRPGSLWRISVTLSFMLWWMGNGSTVYFTFLSASMKPISGFRTAPGIGIKYTERSTGSHPTEAAVFCAPPWNIVRNGSVISGSIPITIIRLCKRLWKDWAFGPAALSMLRMVLPELPMIGYKNSRHPFGCRLKYFLSPYGVRRNSGLPSSRWSGLRKTQWSGNWGNG